MFLKIEDYLLHRPSNPGPLPKLSPFEIEQGRKLGKLLNPVVVRALPRSPASPQQNYEIIQNERSWLLAQRLGWHQIPCLVYEVNDAEVALLRDAQSGIQPFATPKEDPVLFAIAMAQRLKDEPRLSISALAREVGWDRSELQHQLRLAVLPAPVQQMVSTRTLSVGHARRIGSSRLNDQQRTECAREVVSKKLTVRQLEQRLRDLVDAPRGAEISVKPSDQSTAEREAHALKTQLSFLEQKISELIGCGVRITQRELSIDFSGDLEVLDGVLERFGYKADT